MTRGCWSEVLGRMATTDIGSTLSTWTKRLTTTIGAVVSFATLAFALGFSALRAQYDVRELPPVCIDYWAYAETGLQVWLGRREARCVDGNVFAQRYRPSDQRSAWVTSAPNGVALGPSAACKTTWTPSNAVELGMRTPTWNVPATAVTGASTAALARSK